MNTKPLKITITKSVRDTVQYIISRLKSDNNEEHFIDTDGWGKFLFISFENPQELNKVFSYINANEIGFTTFKHKKDNYPLFGLVAEWKLANVTKGQEWIDLYS